MAGGLLVLFAGIFDMFDGAMARFLNTATTFGAFFDSTLDRYSESIILFGMLCSGQTYMIYSGLSRMSNSG